MKKVLEQDFFVNKDNFIIKYGLITNNHILNEFNLEKGQIIKIDYFEKSFFSNYYLNKKEINITEHRKIFINKELDYTCIELMESDNIIDYFEIDPNIYKYKDEDIKKIDIFLLQFPNEVSFSYGKIKEIKDNKYIYNASTEEGSSGSPIIIRYNNKYYVNGLHFGGYNKDKTNKDSFIFNLGTPFNLILEDNCIDCIYIAKKIQSIYYMNIMKIILG